MISPHPNDRHFSIINNRISIDRNVTHFRLFQQQLAPSTCNFSTTTSPPLRLVSSKSCKLAIPSLNPNNRSSFLTPHTSLLLRGTRSYFSNSKPLLISPTRLRASFRDPTPDSTFKSSFLRNGPNKPEEFVRIRTVQKLSLQSKFKDFGNLYGDVSCRVALSFALLVLTRIGFHIPVGPGLSQHFGEGFDGSIGSTILNSINEPSSVLGPQGLDHFISSTGQQMISDLYGRSKSSFLDTSLNPNLSTSLRSSICLFHLALGPYIQSRILIGLLMVIPDPLVDLLGIQTLKRIKNCRREGAAGAAAANIYVNLFTGIISLVSAMFLASQMHPAARLLPSPSSPSSLSPFFAPLHRLWVAMRLVPARGGMSDGLGTRTGMNHTAIFGSTRVPTFRFPFLDPLSLAFWNQTMSLVAGATVVQFCANGVSHLGVFEGTTFFMCANSCRGIIDSLASLRPSLAPFLQSILHCLPLPPLLRRILPFPCCHPPSPSPAFSQNQLVTVGLLAVGYLVIILGGAFLRCAELRLPMIHHSTSVARVDSQEAEETGRRKETLEEGRDDDHEREPTATFRLQRSITPFVSQSVARGLSSNIAVTAKAVFHREREWAEAAAAGETAWREGGGEGLRGEEREEENKQESKENELIKLERRKGSKGSGNNYKREEAVSRSYYPIPVIQGHMTSLLISGAVLYGYLPYVLAFVGRVSAALFFKRIQTDHPVLNFLLYGTCVFIAELSPEYFGTSKDETDWFSALNVGIKGVTPGEKTDQVLQGAKRRARLWGALGLAILAAFAQELDRKISFNPSSLSSSSTSPQPPSAVSILFATGYLMDMSAHAAMLVKVPDAKRRLLKEKKFFEGLGKNRETIREG